MRKVGAVAAFKGISVNRSAFFNIITHVRDSNPEVKTFFCGFNTNRISKSLAVTPSIVMNGI